MAQIISQSHLRCIASLEKLSKDAESSRRCSEDDKRGLLNEIDKYKIWAGNVGAGQTCHTNRLSLDYRLREATFYKHQVSTLMDTLRKHAEIASQILSGERIPFEESSSNVEPDDDSAEDSSFNQEDDSPWDISGSESDDDSLGMEDSNGSPITRTLPVRETELGQLLESIKVVVRSLYRMPIQRPAPVDRLEAKYMDDFSSYYESDYRHVRDKFPRLNEAVAGRLGRLITRRRRLLAYRKTQKDQLRPKDGNLEFKVLDQSGSSFQEFPSITTVLEGAQSSDTESISSSPRTTAKRARETSTKVPPRPKDSNGTKMTAFKCNYCVSTTHVSSDTAWINHVLSDIQPYVCTFPDCSLGDYMFETQEAWFLHETEVHRCTYAYFCNNEGHPVFTQVPDFNSHMKDVHGIENVLEPTVLDIFRRVEGLTSGSCNLCFREKPTRNIKSHISRHLEQVALFAIPEADFEEENDESSATGVVDEFSTMESITSLSSDKGAIRAQEDENSAKGFAASGGILDAFALLLTIVPAIGAAAKHQRGVYSAVNTVVRSKVKDERLAIQYQHLHNEVAFLHLTIRDVVSNLTLSANDKERVLKLDRQLLTDVRLVLALSQTLGNAWRAFVDTLNTALECLDDVLSDHVLGLDKYKVTQAPLGLYRKLEHLRAHGGNPRDLGGRIEFTSSNSKRRRALATLTEQNKILERFIRHVPASDKPQASQTTQETDCGSPPPPSSRNQIQNMCDAVSKVWNLYCNCSSPHEAMLSLCGCFAWVEDEPNIKLDLFISTEDRKWQESRVIVEPVLRPDSVFQFDSGSSAPSSYKSSTPTAEGQTPIYSICSVIANARRKNVALDLTYQSNRLLHKVRKTTAQIMINPCTLDHLLRHESQRKLKERRILAVIFAHALLHLCGSNLWKKEWDKTQIYFFSSAPDQLNLRPYLMAQFQALEEEREELEMQLHPSPAILALGILLLELQIWGTIESRRIPDDLTDDGSVNVNTNLLTAERVFQEADDEIFENYRKAVRACLDCDFLDEHEVNFNDEGFRSLVYANIVAPLERELYQGWKMSPGDLLSVFL